MPNPRKYSDMQHARIYKEWFDLPSWKALSSTAQRLLMHMLAEYLPGNNGRLEWSLTRVQEVTHCGRAKASESLTALENNGWIALTRVGRFCGSRKPSLYRLTRYDCSVTGEPATWAFKYICNPPYEVRKKNRTGANKTVDRFQQAPDPVPTETARVILPTETPSVIQPQKPINNSALPAKPSQCAKPQKTAVSQILLETELPPCASSAMQRIFSHPIEPKNSAIRS